MATFRIHEDQENRRAELRNKENINLKNVLHQSRTVLGALDNNSKKNLINLKQPFVELKIKNENTYVKQAARKPIPVVPVAQFEAFKVYEDKHEEKRLPEKKAIEDVAKKENLFVEKTITETPMSEEKKPDESPMSIEKSQIVSKPLQEIVDKSMKIKQERDIFFEMPEYRKDIYKYLREAELRNRPKAGYMKKQPDITYSMRTILVDWLVEVAEEYRLQTETLYLAVSYIDRFLSYMSVVRAKLQLVGTAAMFIASKYEEIYPPDVGEFVYITDDTYNKKQVLRMEQLILKVLSFDLSIPTPLTFLTKFCVATNQTDRNLHLAMYLCELSMLEADPFLLFLPSMLAASALYVARDILELEAWPEELEKCSNYNLKHMQPCINFLHKTFSNASSMQQQAIQEKYKSSKYQHVSMLSPPCLNQTNNEHDDNEKKE